MEPPAFQNKDKTCQRCKRTFYCQPENVAACQCAEVRLSEATRSYLKQARYDCLCKHCLSELNEMAEEARKSPFPVRPGELVEGRHYYRENGLWVFTEFYHLQRGYCCGNHCRHCAYGIHLV